MGFFQTSGILNRKGFLGGAASSGGETPSGLPVASTNSINLVDPDFSYQNGNYPKIIGYTNFTDDNSITTTNQYGYTSSGAITNGYPLILFNVTTNRWEFGSYQPYGDGGLAWETGGGNCAINSSTNPNYIPTSGWSRNIVITAA